MNAVRVVEGLYIAPSVRFGRGNQILQIQDNSVVPIADLETELTDMIAVATAQNEACKELETQVSLLNAAINEEAINDQNAINDVPSLQTQLNQINTLIQASAEDNFTPYFSSWLPVKATKGVGDPATTLPQDQNIVYSFTPSEGNDGVFYNYPQTLLSISLPSYTTPVLYQFSVALSLLSGGPSSSQSTKPSAYPFYNTYKASSNGGIVFFAFIVPSTGQILYSSQHGSVSTTQAFPISQVLSNGAAVSYFTDVVSIPANTPNVYLSFFVSTHYSMSLSQTAYSQSQYYLSGQGIPLQNNQGYLGITPLLTMLKL